LLHHRSERNLQRLEMALPLVSVRRSLRSVFLNGAHPVHGTAVYPKPDARLHPFNDWHVSAGAGASFRDIIPPQVAARRLVGNWQYSRLQDQCLRKTLSFLREREIKVILYQLPVHPDVVEHMRQNPQYAAGYAKFLAYVDTLGVPAEDRVQLLDIAECGVPVRGMRDLTHFNEVGANVYWRWLGARLRSLVNAPAGVPIE
jgi:hypothetical protein